MRPIKMLLLSACLTLIIFSNAHAKEWRGITPLHSTCEDVKRILGISKCEITTYYLKDENVFISFSEYACGVRLPEGWNVPVGTVIHLTVYPKKKPKLSDLHINESRFQKTRDLHVPDSIHYTDKDEGFSFIVSPDGVADSFMYFAAAKDYRLRCPSYVPPTQVKPDEVFYDLPPFDIYKNICVKEENTILDNLAIELQVRSPATQGYIIAYAGQRALRGEAQARADRAKDYLVKTRGIKAERIVAIDGGYRDEATVELWLRPPDMAAPSATPTVHPGQVQIIKAPKAKIGKLKCK